MLEYQTIFIIFIVIAKPKTALYLLILCIFNEAIATVLYIYCSYKLLTITITITFYKPCHVGQRGGWIARCVDSAVGI